MTLRRFGPLDSDDDPSRRIRGLQKHGGRPAAQVTGALRAQAAWNSGLLPASNTNMLRRSLATFAIVMSTALLCSMQSLEERWQNEDAIRRVIRAVEEAWNARDGAAFAASFTADAEYVSVNGQFHKNGSTVAGPEHNPGPNFARIPGPILKTLEHVELTKNTVERIRFLRPDVAVVHFSWTVRLDRTRESDTAEVRNTMCLTKEAGQWRIETLQSTQLDSQ